MLNNHCFELAHSRQVQEPSVPYAWAGCAGNQHCCRHRCRRDGGRRQRCGCGTRVDPTCCIANVLAMQRAAAFQLGMTHCCRQISIAAGTGADLMAGAGAVPDVLHQPQGYPHAARRGQVTTWASRQSRALGLGVLENQYSSRHGCRRNGRRPISHRVTWDIPPKNCISFYIQTK